MSQFLPQGALHVLGGVLGAAMFIEDFCPIALQYRAPSFPRLLEVQRTRDPAGSAVRAPANIFVTRRGEAKILDFGLAKLAREPRAAAEAAMVLPAASTNPRTGTTSLPGSPGLAPHPQRLLIGSSADPRFRR